MIIGMAGAAMPSFRAFGWRFLYTSTWDPACSSGG